MIVESTPRLGPAAGGRAAIDRATRSYLNGEPLDMKKLAAELGIGRATLYRWVGGREDLLATVLAESTARTFDAAARRGTGTGVELVTSVCAAFMRSALAAEPLRILTSREPLLYIRLATAPGAIEQTSSECVRRLLEQEVDAGHMTLAMPPSVLAEAVVRICDSHVYAHLLGRGEPRVDVAVRLIQLLLRP